jgi:dynein intermediate chain
MEVDASASLQSPLKTTTPSSPRRNMAVDTTLSATSTEVDASAVPALSDEEKKLILESEDMDAFLLKASRVIERALNSSSKFDIMIDYGATVEQDTLMEEVTESLKQQFAFTDDKWSKHRAVTDVDVSPFFPELTLVSYTARDFLDEEEDDTIGSRQWDTMGNSSAASSALTDVSAVTDGVVLLWSTALPTRPEYRFTCHSQVTSACFNPFDRHIIIGGTYSGQIVVWDTRAKSAPVRKTSLSSCSHTHPIYAMTVVGSKSSYQYVCGCRLGIGLSSDVTNAFSDILQLGVSEHGRSGMRLGH